jgi:BNR repeat protein
MMSPMVTPTTTLPEAQAFVALFPANPNNAVAVISDFSLRGGYNTTKYAVSFNNGAAGTWTENFVPLRYGLPATSDGRVWEANSDPVVAIDKLGNVFVSSLYFNVSNRSNGIYVAIGHFTCTDLGLTVANTIPVTTSLSTPSSIENDKDWLAVDNSNNPATSGNVYVSWTRFDGTANMILVSSSTDHGQTWSSPLQVSDAWQNGGVQGSQIAVGPSGEVFVAYEVFFAGNRRQHYLVKSSDGGRTFTPSTAITPPFNEIIFSSTYRKNSFPSLAVSPTNGHVFVVYSDQPTSTTGAEVEFVVSRDGGATFTMPATLNHPPEGNQFMPALAVNTTGAVHVSWFDTRNNGLNTSAYDIYTSRSVDDGASFTASARVTPSSIDAGATSFIGDYMGIVAGGGFVHPVWTSGGLNNGYLQTATLY